MSSSSSNNDSSSSTRVPQFPEKKEDFNEYVIRMEVYLDSKDVLDVVLKGVKTIPKDRAGTLDDAATELSSEAQPHCYNLAEIEDSIKHHHSISSIENDSHPL
jgi:hypothetical protein